MIDDADGCVFRRRKLKKRNGDHQKIILGKRP